MTDVQRWWVRGSYFEACNCEAVCPCRMQGGAPGGSSTYGACQFALSWLIADGRFGEVDLAGLGVVLAGRYFDDEELAAGRPVLEWEVALYIDDRADAAQASALEDIFLGRAGGDTLRNYAAAIGPVRAVRRAALRLDHTRGRQRVTVDSRVTVQAREPVAVGASVSCAIPGHDRPGQEWVADVLRVSEPPLLWEVGGRCAFAADFDYRS